MSVKFYKDFIRPVLFSFEPEFVHEFTVNFALKNFYWFVPDARAEIKAEASVEVAGIKFPNRIGLAGGMDKNAVALKAWERMGFGFVEIGTVTNLPQEGNQKPRLFRIKEEESILNRMGFNNLGADKIKENLAKNKVSIPIGVNVGKSRAINSKDKDAVIQDYLNSISKLEEFADYITINVSSPNTPGLRDWEKPAQLSELLKPISEKAKKPLFVKISPDLENEDVEAVLALCDSLKFAGIIATNTTTERENMPSWTGREQGGISGKLLKEKSLSMAKFICERKPKSLAFISVGGIASKEDVKERLQIGADLVQIYTSFIYEGISLVKECANA